MRKRDLLLQLDPVPFSSPPGGRTPFADAIQCEECRFRKRTGKESTGGMALMMFCKNQFCLLRVRQRLSDGAVDVKFIFQPDGNCHHETAKARRRECQIRLKQPLKLYQRLFVKNNKI